MEAHVPGLGGAFLENGNLVVYVPASARRSDVLAGLAQASPSLTVDPLMRGQIARGERIELRIGRFPFSQLVAWEEQSAKALAKLHVVSFSDANEGLNKVTIGVMVAQARGAVLQIFAAMGVPGDAIDIVVHPMERAGQSIRSTFSQTGSGIQIANVADQVCSLGWNEHRGGEDPATAEEGFFTAGHCATNRQPGLGITGPMFQPNTSRQIGYITQNPAWDVQDPNCDYSYCTKVDAMYVKYDDPSISLKRVAVTSGPGINNAGGGTDVGNWWADLSGMNYSYYQGALVDKVGRTTGWTRGTLTNTCAKTNVGPPGFQPYTVLCAGKVVTAQAGEGDSGGPVFQIDFGPKVVPHGIFFSFVGTMAHNEEGLEYCIDQCAYSYSSLARIHLFLREPPY